MFIPKRMRDWQPEHFRGTPKRRCHWCATGPHRLGQLIQVLESPMRYYFCQQSCLELWREHRHDAEVVEWLKQGAGTRAKILKSYQDETGIQEAGDRDTANLRIDPDLQLPLSHSNELPPTPLCSKCGVSKCVPLV